ncbi:heparinase II/III family protein [Bacillus sp. FSL K6-3431]|uniref:heparinase II/III family protein n=1 Tax=Bacillus sp. FSL K6-3431 TaxID=2921500 RepID=UPI0030FB6DC7
MKIADIEKYLVSKNFDTLLFSNREEKAAWRKKVKESSVLDPMIREIKLEADRLVAEPTQEITYSLFRIFQETGSRQAYEQAYFEKRRRLNTFAIMVLLEPDCKASLKELENIIWSICNEYTWCLPAHLSNSSETEVNHHYSLKEQRSSEISIDLFAAETAFSLSEILILTEEYLDPLICKRIYHEVYRRILWPFHNQKSFGWEKSTHNWAAVCAGSIGAAAIYLLEDNQELSEILERVLSALGAYLSGFNEDGTCLEGYGYWQYGFGYYVYFTDLLKKRTNGAIDLFQSEKIHQIALFQQKVFLNKNVIANFSDALPQTNLFLGLSHFLNDIYPDVELPELILRAKYTDDHCSRWAPAFRNLLWSREEDEGKPWKSASYHLKESAWFISRHCTQHGTYAFAAKGGHNAEPHNHNDIGHFMLLADDEVFLKDLGSGMYSKDYFGQKRYSFLCTGSQGHSVPIINDEYQIEGAAHHAVVKQVKIGQEVETFKLEMSKAYVLPDLQEFIRTFTWDRSDNPKLILEDIFLFNSDPESIVERFITSALTIYEDNKGVILQGKSKLHILYDRNLLRLNIKELSFINHFGDKETISALDFKVINPSKKEEIQFEFQFE